MQWLKEVPSHWEERRLKTLVTCNDEALSEKLDKDTEIQYVEIGDVDQINGIKNSTFYKFKDAPSRARRITRVGDIIISTVRTYLKAIAYIDKQDLIVSTGFAVLRPQNVLPRFLAYATMCDGFTTEVLRYSIGISYPAISSNDLLGLKIALPPRPEQEIIVSYLENKTSKIDAYVADKEKEIQLLQELKQETIAEAVTKGLNPNVKMKDSGISWIGMIPKHWEIKRAKYMFIKNKRNRRPEDEVITCFRDGQVTLRKNRRLTGFTESEKYDGYQGIRKGDLVIHQMDAFAGSIGVSDSDGMGTSVYHCCTPIGDYNVYYYAFLIRQMALSGFIQSLYKGIRERSSDFSFPVFGNQYLVIPPRTEQNEIVANIEEKCQKIDTLITEFQAEIDYLKEYKQRLIADVVTGQVNVQNETI
jgi:type I restriction enzyme S subunit